MIEPIEGERQCTRCLQCKPMSEFSMGRRGRRVDRPRSQCKECERARGLARYHANKGDRGTRLWLLSEADVSIIREHYPRGGAAAVMRLMPDKSREQIQQAARRRGIRYAGPPMSGSAPKGDEAWGVPAHDYTEADIALRGWREAMPVVGVFSPSLGLVMGVAA